MFGIKATLSHETKNLKIKTNELKNGSCLLDDDCAICLINNEFVRHKIR